MNNKTRVAIKSIVKECLIEILAEGLVSTKPATIRESRELRGTLQESYENNSRSRSISERSLSNQVSQVTPSRKPSPRTQSYLDSVKMGVDSHQNQEVGHVKKQVQSLTNDPIMSDILADTAMTTLKEQKENGRASGPSIMAGGDQAAKIVDQSIPEDLFGGSANKWAELAFAPSIRSR